MARQPDTRGGTTDTVTARVRRRLGPAAAPLGRAKLRVECALRRPQPDEELSHDAQAYWNGQDPLLEQHAHWRGAGPFEDGRWLAMGAHNLAVHRTLLRVLEDPPEVHRMVEWGCGGGANAVHFAPLVDQYVGVDVSADSLAECGRQLEAAGVDGYVPVLIDAADPEAALDAVPGPVELFLCTYVFEVLPSTAHAVRVLRIARRLLAEGGVALVQARCKGDRWDTKPRGFAYHRNMPAMTSFTVDELWGEAERAGFTPQAVQVVLEDPFNGSGPYAYFLLRAGPPARLRVVGP